LTNWDEWAAEFIGFANKAEEEGKARMAEIIGLMKAGIQEVKEEEEFAAKWYLRATEKISNDTKNWLQKETKRCVFLLFVPFNYAFLHGLGFMDLETHF
jgi:predicted NUDIX family phosphoesterase